ncbi:MAG TPA: hypothetical protein VNU94_05125 [Acidobacteriaceae bacterium]|jgi:hypothetical protein|nr:hypothetical protein [Acidobacteriaceae bacterium]
MKRIVVIAVLALLCVAAPTPAFARYGVKRYLKKETTTNMTNMNHVCVGWVDLGVDQWGRLEYDTKGEWSAVIDGLNDSFVSALPVMYLPGKTVTGAKNKDDESMAGCDLYVKFSNVYVDYDNYHLILAIDFIDPKTNTEIGTIPVRPYFGDAWGLRGYLDAALKEVSTKLTVEITGALPPKPKK